MNSNIEILEKDKQDIENGMPIEDKADEIMIDLNKHIQELVALV